MNFVQFILLIKLQNYNFITKLKSQIIKVRKIKLNNNSIPEIA